MEIIDFFNEIITSKITQISKFKLKAKNKKTDSSKEIAQYKFYRGFFDKITSLLLD